MGWVRSVRRIGIIAVLASLFHGCGTDPLAVTVETVSGEYEATELVLQDIDLLASGGHLHLILNPDSTVEGELFVPEELGGPEAIDMAGDYRVRDGFVTFSQAAPTFVTSVPFRWSNGTMSVLWDSDGDSGSVRLVRR